MTFAITPSSPAADLRLHRALVPGCWLAALLLGAVRAWSHRFFVDPDTISYLDMADAYLRGDWFMALNGWWNPLYTWLLCLMQIVARPDPLFEFPAHHVVNYLIFAAGLGCVHYLLRQMALYLGQRAATPRWAGTTGIPNTALFLLGYACYTWTSLDLIGFEQGADLLVAAFVYLAAGLLFRIARDVEAARPPLLLGLVLGGAYLTKAVMLPIAVLFFGTALLVSRDWRKSTPRLVAGGMVFIAVAAPFIAALSVSKGRLTWGDTGKSNYALYVTMGFGNNWVPPYFHWQGEVPDAGTPKHPTRRILDHPAVFEFGTPFQATYGAWADPSYWYDGVTPKVKVGNQLRLLAHDAEIYVRLFATRQPALVAGLLFLLALGWTSHRRPTHLAGLWLFALPSVGALGLYAIVHTEERFIGAHVALVWMVLFAGIRFSGTAKSSRIAGVATMAAVAALALSTFLPGIVDDVRTIRRAERGSDDRQVRVAQQLGELGLTPGTKVAHIGNSFYATWARLARVRIVAEITRIDAADYWSANPALKEKVRETLAGTGAVAVLSDHAPSADEQLKWERLDPKANVYLSRLTEAGPKQD